MLTANFQLMTYLANMPGFARFVAVRRFSGRQEGSDKTGKRFEVAVPSPAIDTTTATNGGNDLRIAGSADPLRKLPYESFNYLQILLHDHGYYYYSWCCCCRYYYPYSSSS